MRITVVLAAILFNVSIFPTMVTPSRAEESAGDPAPFGFESLEVYRASNESSCLRLHDLDGDELLDIVFAYNTDTSLRILLQNSGDSDSAKSPPARSNGAKGVPDQVNEIQFDE